MVVLPFRAFKERGENTSGAGESQTQAGRRDDRPAGPDCGASGTDRGAEDPAGQKGGGAAGCSGQVSGKH